MIKSFKYNANIVWNRLPNILKTLSFTKFAQKVKSFCDQQVQKNIVRISNLVYDSINYYSVTDNIIQLVVDFRHILPVPNGSQHARTHHRQFPINFWHLRNRRLSQTVQTATFSAGRRRQTWQAAEAVCRLLWYRRFERHATAVPDTTSRTPAPLRQWAVDEICRSWAARIPLCCTLYRWPATRHGSSKRRLLALSLRYGETNEWMIV